MNTIIDVVCYRSKTLSSGESPLMLRLTKEGKRKYVSLQISL
ncbi:MAG TPA: Arm DNA-binding domain-containing protein, partial [Bacteroidales bacterium]|nr:Arm DNA-binding domain-containing protein [Bacteroidales bacterium]